MNKLQLANRLLIETGASSLPMATTIGVTGELQRMVSWLNAAMVDIESDKQDWDWMRKSASFTTTAGQGNYTLANIGLTDFGMWKKDSFRNYVTASGNISEVFMDAIDYDDWRNSYNYGALRFTLSRPLQIAVSPDKGICVGPFPAAGYTLTGDYFRAPRELVGDTDTPDLPAQFHMAIVYRAMMFYGGFESAPEVYDRGEIEFKKLMSRLAQDRLPMITVGGALA